MAGNEMESSIIRSQLGVTWLGSSSRWRQLARVYVCVYVGVCVSMCSCIYICVCVCCCCSRGNYSLGRLFEIQLPASILILMPQGIFVSHLFALPLLSRSFFHCPCLLLFVCFLCCCFVTHTQTHTVAYIIMRTEAVSVYLWQVLVKAWQMLSTVPPPPLPSPALPVVGATFEVCSSTCQIR